MRKKIAIVTGSSRGIGRAIVEQFAAAGMYVYVNSRQEQAAHGAVRAITARGFSAAALVGDATDERFVKDSVKKIIQEHGCIDILVNNVGLYEHKDLENIDLDYWHKLMDINLTSSFIWMREVVPHMKARHSGKVINVSSIAGVIGRKGTPHYSAAKGGLISLSKGLAKDLGQFNITINVVAPANIETAMIKEKISAAFLDEEIKKIPLKRLGRPEDIAGAVLFLASSHADFITGHVLVVDGGRSIA